MKAYTILVYILIFQALELCAQTVQLADTNFRNRLLDNYPQVMQGNELDITQAEALTGVLDLSDANIYDASEVKYFVSINTLRLSNNHLIKAPDISGITGLLNFYASNNQIITFPNISNLEYIVDFQIMDNQLEKLPDITNCSNLQALYCSKNNLTSLPDLSHFPQLRRLVIGDNPFETNIDFSSCEKLIELHLHRTNANRILGLEKLSELEILFAWGNNITDVSALNPNTTLKELFLFGNQLQELPNLANKPNLDQVDVNSCKLTFEDIVPVLEQNPAFEFTYAPQKNIYISNQVFRSKKTESISYPVNNPSPNNTYEWFKNGQLLTSSEELNFKSVNFSDSGVYYLKVKNNLAPDMVLLSDSFNVSILPCIELNIGSPNIIDENCSNGYTLDLSTADLEGGTEPFSFTLKNETFEKTFNSYEIDNLPAGRYSISVSDAKKCTDEDAFLLERISGCDPVLTPNNDGISDTYFIEEEGLIQIFDYNRKLIKTLTGPTTWDGTNDKGDFVDVGYYIILPQSNKTPTYITIIR